MRPVTDLQRKVAPFKVVSDFQPSGDQPAAIEDIERRIRAGEKDVVLLGATGTGKTATVAWAVERLQRPTLVMQPNKTLAAQFANELRQLLPDNAVEYFVSYYDYYQPEAYVPQTDTYIEKESQINDQIDRMRHSATRALLERDDVIIVASVSCIYGIGSRDSYREMTAYVEVGRPSQLQVSPFLRGFFFTGVQAILVNDVPSRAQAAARDATRLQSGSSVIAVPTFMSDYGGSPLYMVENGEVKNSFGRTPGDPEGGPGSPFAIVRSLASNGVDRIWSAPLTRCRNSGGPVDATIWGHR